MSRVLWLATQFCAALDTAHVCADGRSVNADAIAHFPGRQAACPKPQSFSDLPHRKSRHWGPPAPSKRAKAYAYPPCDCSAPKTDLQNTCPRAPESCPRQIGIIVRDTPVRAALIADVENILNCPVYGNQFRCVVPAPFCCPQEDIRTSDIDRQHVEQHVEQNPVYEGVFPEIPICYIIISVC